MCTSPLHIKNPKLDFSPLNDKPYIMVPCGHCPECRRVSQLSWTVRLYYEFKNSCKHNGNVFYYTLTYNNGHLPTKFGFPVFSKRDVQLFLKRLRKNLQKFGYKKGLKYFLVSEYGHEHFRPHYHLLVFTYGKLDSYVFKRCLSRAWSVKNDWKHSIGFIAPGKYGDIVNSVHPLKYVVKYLQKDIDFMPLSDKLKEKIMSEFPIQDDEIPENYYKRIRKILSEFNPFHLQSAHLGECILEFTDDIQKDLGKCLLPSTGEGKYYDTVPLPMYIIRKLFYNDYCPIDSKHELTRVLADGSLKKYAVGDIRFSLNEDGIYQKLSTLESKIDSKALQFDSYKAFKDSDELKELLGDTVDNTFSYIRKLLGSRDLVDVAIYDIVYKDRYDYSVTNYVSDYQDFITPCPSNFANCVISLYNKNPLFKNFDEILNIFQKFKLYSIYLDYNKRIENSNERQIQQHLLDPIRYPCLRLQDNLPLSSFIYSF